MWGFGCEGRVSLCTLYLRHSFHCISLAFKTSWDGDKHEKEEARVDSFICP